jgi:hypothetical protein
MLLIYILNKFGIEVPEVGVPDLSNSLQLAAEV